jgi:hypothetical protein
MNFNTNILASVVGKAQKIGKKTKKNTYEHLDEF